MKKILLNDRDGDWHFADRLERRALPQVQGMYYDDIIAPIIDSRWEGVTESGAIYREVSFPIDGEMDCICGLIYETWGGDIVITSFIGVNEVEENVNTVYRGKHRSRVESFRDRGFSLS